MRKVRGSNPVKYTILTINEVNFVNIGSYCSHSSVIEAEVSSMVSERFDQWTTNFIWSSHHTQVDRVETRREPSLLTHNYLTHNSFACSALSQLKLET